MFFGGAVGVNSVWGTRVRGIGASRRIGHNKPFHDGTENSGRVGLADVVGELVSLR